MKTTLKYSFWIIFVLCLLLPYLANTCLKDFAITATTMLSGLCGLATLYIAILLYDRYGVESKTKERELKAIEESIIELQKVHFVLCFYSDSEEGETSNDYIIPLVFQSKKDDITAHITPEGLSSVLYYKTSGMYACSQLAESISSKVFLPKSIAEAVKQLSVYKYEPQNIPKETRPLTALFASSDKFLNSNVSSDDADLNIPELKLSVIGFIDAYFGIKESIVEWYKDNGLDLSKLNLNVS